MTLKQLLLSMEGRIGRKAYWLGVTIFFAAECAAAILDGVLFSRWGAPLSVLLSLAVIYPSIALSAKRWHDRDKSGWWMLIGLVPLVGAVWTIVENGFLRGTPRPNRFGPDPISSSALV